MQGNQTTYKRAEGESTQWEDIQRKLGNFAPKEPVQKAKAFESAREPDKVRDLIESEEAAELEGMEDEFADDQFLEQYREHRLRQLQEAKRKSVFGTVGKISKAEFVAEVTNASKDTWVVVHLYMDKVPASGLLGECFEKLAAKFTGTKFLKIIANDCIPGYPERNVPTVLIYHDTQCKHNLVGLLPFGGSRLTPDSVAFSLSLLGPILQEPDAGE